MLYECLDCGGKISRYYAEMRVCQDCKRIVNIDDLLKFLRELGITEQNIMRIQDNLTYPRLFAA